MLCNTPPSEAQTNGIHAKIQIGQHHQFKIYSPNVPLSGNLVINSNKNTAFDKIEISLVGTAVTHNYVQPDPIQATVPFLKLDMRCESNSLPPGRFLEAGTEYSIPFNFVIPRQLPMGSCKHRSITSSLQERHLRLPPSIGLCPGNEQSPEAAQIRYSIVAIALKRVYRFDEPIILFTTKQSIRVLPPSPEDPPLDCFGKIYRLSNTRRIWKNIFRDTGGELTATAWQPKAVMISPDGSSASNSFLHLQLAFVPSSIDLPPIRVTSISGKLLCKTIFDIMPISHAPALEHSKQGVCDPYCDTRRHTLFHRQVGAIQWTANDERSQSSQRNNSTASCQSTPAAQTEKNQEPATRRASLPWVWKSIEEPALRYTAELDIPFTVPHGNKSFFLPTFDLCTVSRAYSLKITLRVGPMQRRLTLSVPMPSGVEGAVQRTGDHAGAQGIIDDFFVELGGEEYEEPPSYTARL